MGHAHDHRLHAVVGSCVQQFVQQRNHRLGPVEPEPLLSQVLGLQELFEGLRVVQLGYDPGPLLGAHRLWFDLDPGLHPPFFHGLLNVHVLDPDRATVRVAQEAEHRAKAHLVFSTEPSDCELPLQIPDREPVGDRVQLWMDTRWLHSQWIEIRDQMTASAVHVDQLKNA